jgi:hypothetical protein
MRRNNEIFTEILRKDGFITLPYEVRTVYGQWNVLWLQLSGLGLCDVAGLQQERTIVNSDDAVQVEGYIVKVKGIRDVLKRDHMKVAFFGR